MNTDASVTTHYYVDESDDPTDLLKELVPPQLSELDLPHAPKRVPSKSISTNAIRIPYKLYKSLND